MLSRTTFVLYNMQSIQANGGVAGTKIAALWLPTTVLKKIRKNKKKKLYGQVPVLLPLSLPLPLPLPVPVPLTSTTSNEVLMNVSQTQLFLQRLAKIKNRNKKCHFLLLLYERYVFRFFALKLTGERWKKWIKTLWCGNKRALQLSIEEEEDKN